MAKEKVLVTGSNGQLGKELQCVKDSLPTPLEFVFVPREDLPIENFELILKFFDIYQPAFCINCAAYTAVDRAESERDLAFLVNGEAVGALARACQQHGTKMIHISTDYVFDGKSSKPYKETDQTAPINIYGASKLRGEQLCLQYNPDSVIIRTSWVYSPFGKNFVKTMIRLMSERESISVVNDQVGAPTYAFDLAIAITKIIGSSEWSPGIFNFSNSGRTTWFDFAREIRSLAGLNCDIHPISSAEFSTPAERPLFSLLDSSKIEAIYNITPPEWKNSLKECIRRIQALST